MAGAPSDAELWSRVAAGQPVAFGELFDRHAGAVFNLCFRRTGDRNGAEDLVSATFLHAWRRRAEFRVEGDTVLPLLYGIALNLARRHNRGIRRQQAAMARLPTARGEPDPAEDIAHRLDDDRRAERALGALRSLPDRDRDLFVLCVWQGLTYRQAAEALDIPLGTIRSRLSRARNRLRWLLEEPTTMTGDERGEQAHAGQRKEERL